MAWSIMLRIERAPRRPRNRAQVLARGLFLVLAAAAVLVLIS